MASSKLLSLLVILSVALAYGEVDLGKLAHDTSVVQSELDSILAQAQVDPMSRVSERPLAPRPTTAAERRMLRPILVESSAATTAAAFPSLPSLLQRADTVLSGSSQAPNIFPAEGGYIPPDLNLPEPREDVFQQERLRFNTSAPTSLELRLRKVFPKQVVLESHPGLVDADKMVKAEEILPRDPNTEQMLRLFNDKYGVSAAGADVPDTKVSKKDLHDIEDREEENEIQRDYRAVYDTMNQNEFDTESATLEDLDKRLSTLWSKRWEYLEAERVKANENVNRDVDRPAEYPVDALFVGAMQVEDPGSSIGKIITRNDHPASLPVVESIADRVNFEPEVSFEGPNVMAVSVDKASIPNPNEGFTPLFGPAGKPEPAKMTIIPSSRVERNRFRKLGFRRPEFKQGDELDWNAAVKPAYTGSVPFAVRQNDEIVAANYF